MDIVAWSILIFVARVVDVSLGTIRVQLIVRRKKLLAALTGFQEVRTVRLMNVKVIQPTNPPQRGETTQLITTERSFPQ